MKIAILFPMLTIFWIGLPCFEVKPVVEMGFMSAVLPGSWLRRLLRLRPFSMSILLNWFQVMKPLQLLSAY